MHEKSKKEKCGVTFLHVVVFSTFGHSRSPRPHLAPNCSFLSLFQCEDERFELDMVIEAGASAIKLLEPMEEEINGMESTAGVNILQVS